MKLIFFLVAFCLVFLRVFFSCSGLERKDKNEATVTINNDGDYEQIKYSGQIKLNNDETAIESISPGGYMKYRKNDQKLVAEGNLHGDVSYELYDENEKIGFEGNGERLITEAIKELVAYGFDATQRMERIYKKGGNPALLNELEHLKLDNVRTIYLDRLFSADSLSDQDRVIMLQSVRSLGSDQDKVRYLDKVLGDHLNNPKTIQAYFETVANIGSDEQKQDILLHLVKGGSIREESFDRMLDITSRLGSDMEKENLLIEFMNAGAVTGDRWNRVLEIAANIGSDMSKENLYKKLIQQENITEPQWISIINKTTHIGSEHDRSDILTLIAGKIPESESIKSAYLKAAATISSEQEHRRTVKAAE